MNVLVIMLRHLWNPSSPETMPCTQTVKGSRPTSMLLIRKLKSQHLHFKTITNIIS